MQLLGRHVVLVEGDDPDTCRDHVLNFFEQTSLVRYDNIVVEVTTLSAKDPGFEAELAAGLNRNRLTLRRFVDELVASGFEGKGDLLQLEQG